MKPLWESLEGCAMFMHSASVSSPLNEGEKTKKEKHQKMKSFVQWQQLAGMWRQSQGIRQECPQIKSTVFKDNGTPKHEPAEDREVKDLQ